MPVYAPLVQQLVQQLFDDKAPELPELVRHDSSALGSLLKTGFRCALIFSFHTCVANSFFRSSCGCFN